MIETIHLDEDTSVTFDIPEAGAVGAFMSGGADSSLMCYIMAKIIRENNLPTQIIPCTTEFLARPYNLRCAFNVLQKISDLTGLEFPYHPNFIMPNYDRKVSDDEKVVIMSGYTRAYAAKFGFEVMYNGLTANPPLEFIEDNKFGERQTCRDDMSWRQQQENKKGLAVPFIHIDKKGIGRLYKKFGILDSIFPLTRSCEAEMDETEFFTKDCFDIRPKGEECWWCRERAYGFKEFL